MTQLSRPIEDLIRNAPGSVLIDDADVVIVGSGYGGSVAAVRLAGEGRRVVMLERGKEYGLGDFPYDENDIPSHIKITSGQAGADAPGYSDALFNIHRGEQTDVLVGSGLGGTSLINANVAEEPGAHVFKKAGWPQSFRDSEEQPLQEAFEKIKGLLSVAQHPTAEALQKYKALSKLSDALEGDKISSSLHPANIAVSFAEGNNAVGVKQYACTDCGNCVTGCNTGAKNTLDRNLLPLAKSRGAEIYTGVTVLTIEQGREAESEAESEKTGAEGRRYTLTVKTTVQMHGTIREDCYQIQTDTLILAAGTLGSTEILLRSKKLGLMACSERLGEQFSTNGDGLIMSYGQNEAVDSIAEPEQHHPRVKPGPTITGITKVEVGSSQNQKAQKTHLTIEEASIPASVARFYKEALVTSAMLQRLSNRAVPTFIKDEKIDPLAASNLAAKHSQALLIMGDDNARGVLSLTATEQGHEREATLHIDFPNVGKNTSLVESNRIIKLQDRKKGLDYGQYAPNPLWELLPGEASTVLSGALPKSRAITVHPLGGCAMGDDIKQGVVDHTGNLFNPSGKVSQHEPTPTYAGLYVLDGAIIPTALEVNPFLTIAALAWRNSGFILETLGWQESQTDQAAEHSLGVVPDSPFNVDESGELKDKDKKKDKVAFLIREQLFGQLPNDIHAFGDNNTRLKEKDGLIVEVEAEIPDVDQWLDKNHPLTARMNLYTHPFSESEVKLYRPYGVAPEHLRHKPFEQLNGTFNLLTEDSYCWWSDFFGGCKAIYAYHHRRDNLLLVLWGKIKEWLGLAPPGEKSVFNGLKSLLIFFNIGALQSRKRRLVYEFKSKDVTIKGEKVIGYAVDVERLWPALLNLDAEIRDKTSSANIRLSVNVEYMTDAGFLKLVSPKEFATSGDAQTEPVRSNEASLPEAIFAGISVAGLFARSLFSTNFWEFGGLDYPEEPIKQKTLPIPIRSGNTDIEPVFETLNVQISEENESCYSMLMTNYPNVENKARKKPVLLIHGLAQGSQIYWTNTLEKNLASYMHEYGYDVWMVDYRLSNHVLPNMSDLDWTMDEIARYDIPAMIDHIYDLTEQKVTVFAHCVGACTLAMSSLAGHVSSAKIQSAAINAIHPWIESSPANRVRSKFGQFNREWVETDQLDPIPKSGDGAAQNIMDRLAFSVAKIRELELDDHKAFGSDELANGICDRMTLLYGRMWNHKNLNPATHRDFAHMFGPAPSKVYQHLYYYSLQKRITDKNGDNKYLTRENIKRHWTFPTFFIHGEDSRVFNPASAIRSAERLAQFTTEGETTLLTASKVFDDYGHMDVIFGKHAHSKVYPCVTAFYEQALTQETQQQPDYQMVRRGHANSPRMGPILRAASIVDGEIHLRLWLEARVNQTRKQNHFDVCGDQVELVAANCIKPGNNKARKSRHWMIDVKITKPEEKVEFWLYGTHQKPNRVPGNIGVKFTIEKQGWYLQLKKQLVRPIDSCSFLVGSCRFPGTVIDNDRSDNIFMQMNKHTSNVQATFLIGDQIYVDATDQLFSVKSLRSKYRYRYQRAFSPKYSPQFAALTKNAPTHFTLDDHEYEDGWSGTPELPEQATTLEKARHDRLDEKVEYGRRNALRFQSAERNRQDLTFTPAPSAFSYALEPSELAFPTYVLDTRTDRQFRRNSDPTQHHMIDESVRDHLKRWLCEAQKNVEDAPKFIMSGSIVAPIEKSYVDSPSLFRQQDGWHGYPQSVDWLFTLLAEHQIQNVVLIGGDEHMSAIAQLTITSASDDLTPITAWQIVASGLYSPMPFANSNERKFTWNKEVAIPLPQDSTLKACYSAVKLSSAASQFVKVSASNEHVTTTCYDANNFAVSSQTFDLKAKLIR